VGEDAGAIVRDTFPGSWDTTLSHTALTT
jgi:hypothetical protein